MELILFVIWIVVIIILATIGFMIKNPLDDDIGFIFGVVLWPFALLGIVLGIIVALIAEYVFGKEYPK